MHREPEVSEAEAQVGKWFDCPARITSKELAPIHSVESGTLQNACSTSPRVVADLENSALVCIARLTNSRQKRSKKNGDKSAVAMLKITRQFSLRISRYGAAEVYNDFAEELKHTEANPTCEIHESYCTSH